MERTAEPKANNASRRRNGAASVFGVRAMLLTVTALLTLTGALEPFNFALMDLRFRLLERALSDTLVIVEIDPYSLKEENRWPWPRDRYARVVDNLQNAGAQLIAFDVDFSSRSDYEGDAALAAALARRPGEVILPVFWQWSSRSKADGALMKTPPNDIFLRDAVIAGVTLTTESNGVVRRGWRSFPDDGVDRDSVAAVLAGVPAGGAETFYIDYAFDPSKITRLSFRDVMTGAFSADIVHGKNILIGSTALELGDEFPAPVHGVTPGVLFHAFAYESLLGGRALMRLHPLIGLLIAAGVIAAFTHMRGRLSMTQALAMHAGFAAILFGGPLAGQALAPVSIDAGGGFVAQALCAIYLFSDRLHDYARQVLAQRAATARYQALAGVVVRDNADGVIVASRDGVIELANDRADALLGTPAAPGARLADIAPGFPQCDPDTAQSAHADYIIMRDATATTVEVVASPSSSAVAGEEGAALIVYTLRDISARKRIEAAERQAKDAAIAANRMKSQLISNMSHELRTPLNGVIGFADIMNKESFGPHGVSEYKEFSQNIYLSGKRLLGLVNDMLNIAKLDAGEYELTRQETYIDDVIETAMLPFEEIAERDEKSLRREIEKGLPAFDIDAGVFREMLKHLLSNSLKFTGAGGRILVRARRKNDRLVIEVIDDGCGAPRASLPRLADAFFQADGALNRQHEGAGLGLYLVTKFAALHGGALKYDSDVGKGFAARLVFPGLAAARKQSAA